MRNDEDPKTGTPNEDGPGMDPRETDAEVPGRSTGQSENFLGTPESEPAPSDVTPPFHTVEELGEEAHFGEYLRKSRWAKNMTLRELAGASGLHPSVIIRIEAGHRKATLGEARLFDEILSCNGLLSANLHKHRTPFSPTWVKGAAVLIGTSDYAKLPEIATVRNNLDALEALMVERLGIPQTSVYRVSNPRTLDDVHDTIEVARQAVGPTGGLLIYYSGHGWTDPRGRLLLSLIGSEQHRPWSALRFEEIREQLADSQIGTRVVILDSCFSGAALDRLSFAVGSAMAIEGTYVLTSSNETNASLAPQSEEYTAFSGLLIEALSTGIPEGPRILTVENIYQHIRTICIRRGWPLPERQIRLDGNLVRLTTNAWWWKY
ncbi:caspase, EACC1-associated type [Streptomyces chartreusis]|uniref:caspase, EACC1-associated type n=1 Tax=Streptomyces chartreusis TaxID=1969 RepID=UPI00380D4BDC